LQDGSFTFPTKEGEHGAAKSPPFPPAVCLCGCLCVCLCVGSVGRPPAVAGLCCLGFGSLRWLVGLVPFHIHFADISCFGMSAEFLIYATSKGVLHYVLLADMSFVNEYGLNPHATASRRVVAALRRCSAVAFAVASLQPPADRTAGTGTDNRNKGTDN
jgi:hypothetical protein